MLEIPKSSECPFCEYLDGTRPCAFVSRDDGLSSFLNRTQYEKGALLLVPNDHLETIFDLNSDLLARIYAEAKRIAAGMVTAFGASGFNIFSNNGICAGQSIPHFHVHVVPRYESSQPFRSFRSEEFHHASVDELEKIAVLLRERIST